MPRPLIHVDDVSFRYSREYILEHVSFDINAGDFVGVIGPNGSGKSTLLKIMLGLLTPESGQVNVFGKPVHVGEYTKIGYIPQRMTQLETRFPITVEEVVALGTINRRQIFKWMSQKEKQAVTHALQVVGLEHFRKRIITDLSGGQQQRAFIAKALVGQPELLLLDEPTVGIDSASQDSFYTLLAKLNKKHGLTVIIVSHDIDAVMKEVSSVLCLNKTLIYHGSPKNFAQGKYLEKLYGENKKFIIHGH